MGFELDHIAVACADLATGVAWLEKRLGVPMVAGGQHARFGTHNKLLGLGDGLYLEVIAPDPVAKISGPRWFGLDHAPSQPAWGNWIARYDDLAKHAGLTGPAVAMTRGDLRWQITVPDDGSLPMDGGFPTLIKWDRMDQHPAAHLPRSGVSLRSWDVFHPRADWLRVTYGTADARVTFHSAETTRFRATFDTPNGPKVVE